MTPHQQSMADRIEKLSLGPRDIVIVHDEFDMQTLIEMVNQGIGFTAYGNPILYIKGGLSKATLEDLREAVKIAELQTATVSAVTDMVN